jgi:hypothetical protein
MNPADLSLIASAEVPPSGSQAAGQPPPQQQPTQSVVEDSNKKSGGCSGKGCCGCGCAAIVALILLFFGGVVFTIWQAPRAIGADDWDEAAEVFSGLHKLASGASQGFSRDPQSMALPGSGEGEDPQEVSQGFNEFFGSMEETELSNRDIENFQAHLAEWEESDGVAEFTRNFERLKNLEDDDSFFAGARAATSLYRLFFRAAELGEEYNAHYGQLDAAQRHQHQQLMAIVRASQVTASSRQDPWEQAVADELLRMHDEHRDDHVESRHTVRGALEDPDFDPQALTQEELQQLVEAFATQFSTLGAAINRDSLETWASLSEEERKEVFESVDAPHNLVARYIGGIMMAEEGEPHEFYLRLAGF